MVQQATGALSKIVIGFEPEWGTIATDGFEMPWVSSSLKRTRNKVSSPVIRGDFNPVKPTNGNISVSGQVKVPLDSVASWYWFKAAFNTLTTTGSSPYEHEFKMSGSTTKPSITIEHQFLDLATPKYFQHTGCMITGFSIEIGSEGELMLVLDVVGQDMTIASSPFDAAPTTVTRSALDNSNASIKQGGSTFATSPGTNINVAFNLGADTRFIGGGGKIGVISQNMIKVSGTHDFIFTDTTLLDLAAAGTETTLEQEIIAAADSKVVISCPEVVFHETEPPLDGPQGIAVSLQWDGYYDDNADASAIVVTVTNGEAHA